MTTEQIRNAPIQRRAGARLEQIRAAAIEIYNTPGIGRDRLTTATVAGLANCSIGTIYRYYTDRFAILEDIAPNRSQSPIPTSIRDEIELQEIEP